MTKTLYRWRIDVNCRSDKLSEHKYIRAYDAQEAAEKAKKIWGGAVVGVINDGIVAEESDGRVRLEEKL